MSFFQFFTQENYSLLALALSNTGLEETAKKGFNGLPQADLVTIAGLIVNTLFGLLGVFFVVLIIIGGVQWMTSQGNDEQIKKAQGLIKNAIIGLIVVLAAYAIAWFVMSTLIPKVFHVTV
jgi:hypothetical protein